MAVVTFSCPECGKVLKSSKGTPAGKKIKCPTCAAVFPMPDHDDDEEPATGVSTKPRARGAAVPARHEDDDDDEPRPRRRRLDDDDDDDEDDDDRPRRRARSSARRRSGGGLGLVIGIGAAVLLLILVGAGVGIYFLLNSGVNKGSGNEEPLAFVPAGTEVLVGVDFATLLSDPTLGPQFEKMVREGAKTDNFYEECKKQTGLDFKELFARTLICTDLDTLGQGGGVVPGRGLTMVLRPSRPFDQTKLARAFKNPVRKTAHGKYYYEVTDGDLRTAFMPSDRTLVVSTLTPDRLDALFASDGTTPSVSADAATLYRGVSSTAYSVVIPFEGATRGKIDGAVRQGQGNKPNSMQPLMEQVARGKGMAAWGTVEGQQVKLGVNVLYADAAAASASAKAAESAWGPQKLLLLGGLFFVQAQAPKMAQLLKELAESLKFAGEGNTARVTALVGRTTLADGIAESQKMQQGGGGFGGFNPGPGAGPPNPGGVKPPGGRGRR